MPLLEISNLQVQFPTKTGVARASDGVSLEINQGESLCLVGESGCGKTIVALSIMRLLPQCARVSGEIRFKGENLLSLGEEKMRRIRGRQIAMIFDQPATCLNPVFTVGDQIAEAIKVCEKCTRKESRERAVELMKMVGIPSPGKRYFQYPHEFSGGMQQRAMIATALAFRPALLIADEPTTSLDVTIQSQIMELLKDLTARFKTSLFLITHDLDIAAEMCDSVIVMYAGEIVEKGRVNKLFKEPGHPYSKALLGAVSDNGLQPIRGSVPELARLPVGCRFHPRCPVARDICREVKPQLKNSVRCHW
jgi:oligopeptide/dipeptide ABC transporter ATP-binding protein